MKLKHCHSFKQSRVYVKNKKIRLNNLNNHLALILLFNSNTPFKLKNFNMIISPLKMANGLFYKIGHSVLKFVVVVNNFYRGFVFHLLMEVKIVLVLK